MDDLTRRPIDWAKGRSLSHPYVEDRWSERRVNSFRHKTKGQDSQVVSRHQTIQHINQDKSKPPYSKVMSTWKRFYT